MLTDYYEFTMSNGYFLNGMKDKIAVFAFHTLCTVGLFLRLSA